MSNQVSILVFDRHSIFVLRIVELHFACQYFTNPNSVPFKTKKTLEYIHYKLNQRACKATFFIELVCSKLQI